jgi:hypothetical protein
LTDAIEPVEPYTLTLNPEYSAAQVGQLFPKPNDLKPSTMGVIFLPPVLENLFRIEPLTMGSQFLDICL